MGGIDSICYFNDGFDLSHGLSLYQSTCKTRDEERSLMPEQTKQDNDLTDGEIIKQKVRNYIEAWYQGNAEKGEKSLHPELAKRIVRANPETGRDYIEDMGASRLADRWRSGDGKSTPMDKRQVTITLLDGYGEMASVKLETSAWVDYMHLAKFNGEWVIVNILWELKK